MRTGVVSAAAPLPGPAVPPSIRSSDEKAHQRLHVRRPSGAEWLRCNAAVLEPSVLVSPPEVHCLSGRRAGYDQ